MQLLRDNLTLWTSSEAGDAEGSAGPDAAAKVDGEKAAAVAAPEKTDSTAATSGNTDGATAAQA